MMKIKVARHVAYSMPIILQQHSTSCKIQCREHEQNNFICIMVAGIETGLSVAVYLSVCLTISLFVCLSVCLSVCLFVCLSVCVSVRLSVCLEFRLLTYLLTNITIIVFWLKIQDWKDFICLYFILVRRLFKTILIDNHMRNCRDGDRSASVDDCICNSLCEAR